jgi:hypothetical protein
MAVQGRAGENLVALIVAKRRERQQGSINNRGVDLMRLLASKVMVLALVVVGFGALTAVANADGNGAQTTQYKASYTDSNFGPVSCAGVHQVGKNFPGLGQDSFTCTSTTGLPLTNVVPGQVITFGPNRWFSDYYWFAADPRQYVLDTSVEGTVSLDGMSYTAVAKFF